MASEAPVLRDDYGKRIHVGRTQDGTFCVSITEGVRAVMAVLSGERLTAFTEAVDRQGMPGQLPPVAELGRFPVYGCCEHCEHCGQCQPPGRHCPHGYDQPPHPAPCMFGDCAPGHTVAGEAVVTAPGAAAPALPATEAGRA